MKLESIVPSNKLITEGQILYVFHLQKVPRIVKFTGIESRIDYWSQRKEGMRGYC